tara:strand:+ start:2324 stop:2656 length:333 start_codon:yes stop_codon:yes gene_type:complete
MLPSLCNLSLRCDTDDVGVKPDAGWRQKNCEKKDSNVKDAPECKQMTEEQRREKAIAKEKKREAMAEKKEALEKKKEGRTPVLFPRRGRKPRDDDDSELDSGDETADEEV